MRAKPCRISCPQHVTSDNLKMSTSAPLRFEQVQALIDTVPGFLVPGQERYLFEKVASLPEDALVVEIGSYYGRSSVCLGLACLGTRRKLICIDPWVLTELGEFDIYGKWEANVVRCGLAEHVVPLRGRSQDVLSRWGELVGGAPIDFIFIDGWHEYGPCLQDFQQAFSLVKQGGWIALHDVCKEWPGAMRVWDETASQSLTRHERCSTIACGMKTEGVPLREMPIPPQPDKAELAVHYFTEVAPGTSRVSEMLVHLQRLDFPWCWHVIVPSPLPHGEQTVVPVGRGSVRMHGAPRALGWKDSVEARSAVLATIADECILWELDPALPWTAEQLKTGRSMFVNDPLRTGAWFGTPAGPVAGAWHFYHWFRWLNPAAPTLVAMMPGGGWLDVASVRPFTARETSSRGLSFTERGVAAAA